MRQYEVTFIVDPTLSGDEAKATATTYVDHLKDVGAEIVHHNEMGARQLAYPIKKRNTGVYHCVEFQIPTGEFVNDFELQFRRDERILRFLVVKLDKYGVKYNQDKRDGKIGTITPKPKKEEEKDKRGDRRRGRGRRN